MESITPEHIFNDPIWIEDSDSISPMKSFYKGKTIFLTGGTGFLGQLYVEKLLRCNVKHIYLLGRAKKGKNADERLKETFTGTHFMKLSKQDKNYLNRISTIEGDMSKLKLGISPSDQKDLIENVEIVVHAAADVRFDEKLRTLLIVNLRGTREMLDLASQMKKIQAFTFISTAFSQCVSVRKYVEEKFYDAPVDPAIMIKLGESLSENTDYDLQMLTERIINPWPNTYTYTKSLTEELVRRYASKFPICIVRPSIVIATHEDPVPAWCNNIYGLNGVLVACGLGVLRLLPVNEHFVGDIVCADFVVNSTLAALWITHEDSKKNSLEAKSEIKDPEIYHVISSADRPTTWGAIAKGMCKRFEKYPAKRGLWKACPNHVLNSFWFTYLTLWYHVVPAIFTDIVLKLRGKSFRALPSYRKGHRFMVALSYFTRLEWRFDNTNMKRVLDRMSIEDREYFPSDVRRYSWSEYLPSYLDGLKVYIGQESLDGMEKARKKYNCFIVLHYFVLFFYYGLHTAMFTFFASKLGVFQYINNNVHDTYEFFKNPQLVH